MATEMVSIDEVIRLMSHQLIKTRKVQFAKENIHPLMKLGVQRYVHLSNFNPTRA